MRVGVPREIKPDEYRVATVPSAVRAFTGAGHEVLVEHGAGLGSGITDAEFHTAGATLCERDELFAPVAPFIRPFVGQEEVARIDSTL